MRLIPYGLLLAIAWCIPFAASAQEKKFFHPKIEKIRVGFQPFQDNEPSTYKAGLWTPIHVEVFGGTDGIASKPDEHFIEVQCADSEDVDTRIRIPIAVDRLKPHTVTGFVKTGNRGRDIRVTLQANGREFNPRTIDQYTSLDIDAHLYLSLGSRNTDLQRAVRPIGQADEKDDFRFDSQRRVAFETDVERLPDRWFGYSGVDLIVLSTENDKFLKALANADEQLKALAKWVRRGGRLIVPVQWRRQDSLFAVLTKETAWQPPIPVVPPKDAGNALDNGIKRLLKVEEWGGVRNLPFQRIDPKKPKNFDPIPIARLDPGKVPLGDWEVSADNSADGRPLIARVRYGLGQIVYLAFSLEDAEFSSWPGKDQFLQTMLAKVAPRTPTEVNERDRGFRGHVPDDLTTNLVGQLDNLDITVVKFGYVALFIVLYIVVVGPLDFVLLKYVFKRLEWTWVTFPTVVLGVSLVAYFSAYALKGRDLKINKVDIVDFDLRTHVDASRQPLSVHAYGQSFFTILSPRIQNYTVGLEPNPKFWGAEIKKANGGKDEVLSVDSLTWMGRPSGGPHDMGRGGSSGWLRNAYTFREDGAGLEGVPIPVWTTKAFAASWEFKLPVGTAPFKTNLVYHHKKEATFKLSGQLDNYLGVDLADVWLIYGDRCYPLPGGLKRATPGEEPHRISIPANPMTDIRAWATQNPMVNEPQEPRAWSSNPTPLVKQILFHEKFDTQNVGRNHMLRPLDFGWRVDKDRTDQRDRGTREAILFARVAFISGNAETVTRDHPLPTKLWLGDLPDEGRRRPDLVGLLNQDTFIRVILPVRPAEE